MPRTFPRCLLALPAAVALLLGAAVAAAQPGPLELAASVDVPADVVELQGAYAYAAAGDTLRIVDVSEPTRPALRGALAVSGRIWSIHPAGARLYLAGGLDGLHIVDVSDPDAPTLLATHPTAGQALGVTTSGATALVINLMSGLEIVDVSDGAAPVLVHTEDTPGYQWGIGGGGSRILVVDQPSGVHLFDVSAPDAPVLQGVYAGEQPAQAVTAGDDGRAYIVQAVSGVVEIVDTADPAQPSLLGSYAPSRPGGRMQRVAVRGGGMAVPVGEDGIEWIDVSDPAAPSLTAAHDTPGNAQHAAIDGGILAVADGDALLIYRIR